MYFDGMYAHNKMKKIRYIYIFSNDIKKNYQTGHFIYIHFERYKHVSIKSIFIRWKRRIL